MIVKFRATYETINDTVYKHFELNSNDFSAFSAWEEALKTAFSIVEWPVMLRELWIEEAREDSDGE